MHTYIHKHILAYVHIHTYIHTYTYIHTHTYILYIMYVCIWQWIVLYVRTCDISCVLGCEEVPLHAGPTRETGHTSKANRTTLPITLGTMLHPIHKTGSLTRQSIHHPGLPVTSGHKRLLCTLTMTQHSPNTTSHPPTSSQ